MTDERYHEIVSKFHDGFVTDWSIYDYKDAKEGDAFYMLREDDENGGIIFRGVFVSDPYSGDDWRGTDEKRHYINISCEFIKGYETKPAISVSLLEKEIPEINWRKGHSGELLSEKQMMTINALWDNACGDEVPDEIIADFDDEAGHGDHLSCFDDDIESIITHLDKILKQSLPVSESPEICIIKDDVPIKTKLIYCTTREKDVVMRTTMLNSGDSLEILAFIPYAVNSVPKRMRLINVQEYSNGFEAVLTTEWDNSRFSFFDVDYALHKNRYTIGEYYDFALSAMAYNVERVPDEDMSIELSDDEAERLHLNSNHDESTTLSMEYFVAFLQLDNAYPDNAEFWSPVKSRVKKASCMKHEFYKMEVCITPEQGDSQELCIPIIAKTSDFEEKPSMKASIRGMLWMQGRLIE